MKVYIISDSILNTGHEVSINCVCANLKLAEGIMEAFPLLSLHITEFEVIGEPT